MSQKRRDGNMDGLISEMTALTMQGTDAQQEDTSPLASSAATATSPVHETESKSYTSRLSIKLTNVSKERKDLNAGGKTDKEDIILEEITSKLDTLPNIVADGDSDRYYPLRRSDSNMSQYSDLVEDMLCDQLGKDFESLPRPASYDVRDVVVLINLRMKLEMKLIV